MEMEKTKTGEALIDYFNKPENKRFKKSEEYLLQLGLVHDILDYVCIDSISFARMVKDGHLGYEGIDNLPQNIRKQLGLDIAWHDEQMPLSAGDLPAFSKTKFVYKPSNESKALSNLHRDNIMKRFDLK